MGKRLDSIDRRLKLVHVLLALAAAFASATALRTWALPTLAQLAANKAYFGRTCETPCLFDARMRGYTFEEAKGYLDALGPQARAYYAEWYVPVYDLAFPVTLFAFGILFCLWVTQPGRRFAARLSPCWRLGILVVPIGLFVFDILENLSVLVMLKNSNALNPGLVMAASLFTQAKWIAAYLGQGLAAVLVVLATVGWLRSA